MSTFWYPWCSAMRTITLKTTDGSDAGRIIEEDDGSVKGEGRAANLVTLAPSKDFDGWVESFGHSKYLEADVQS